MIIIDDNNHNHDDNNNHISDNFTLLLQDMFTFELKL